MSVMKKYKEYTAEDKAALNELKAEASEKLGRDVKSSEMLRAVEPECETPEALMGL